LNNLVTLKESERQFQKDYQQP